MSHKNWRKINLARVEIILNLVNVLAGVVISVGVYLNFGLGWAVTVFGLYLAYNIITTIRALHVSNQPEG